jgi:hypothetical protein
MLTADELGKHAEEIKEIFGVNVKDPDRGLRICLGNIRSRFNEGDYDEDTAGQLHGLAVNEYHAVKLKASQSKQVITEPSDKIEHDKRP